MLRHYTTPALAALGAMALAAPIRVNLPSPAAGVAMAPVFEVNDACAAVSGMGSCRPRTEWICVIDGQAFNNYCDTADPPCNQT
jgi:hypothetical protein